MFPLSLTGDGAIWFNEMPYNSVYTWDKLRYVFLVRYYLMSNKLNKKDKVNNFVALPGESVRRSSDKFPIFVRGVPNHCIDDELQNE